jgi:hypothetical protein
MLPKDQKHRILSNFMKIEGMRFGLKPGTGGCTYREIDQNAAISVPLEALAPLDRLRGLRGTG